MDKMLLPAEHADSWDTMLSGRKKAEKPEYRKYPWL